MKKLKVLSIAVAISLLVAAQPAYANAPVITAGGPGSQTTSAAGQTTPGASVSEQMNPGTSGQEHSVALVGPGQDGGTVHHGSGQASPGSGSSDTGNPGAVTPGTVETVTPGRAESGAPGSAAGAPSHDTQSAPPGDQGTVLSPVVTAGGGGDQSEGGQTTQSQSVPAGTEAAGQQQAAQEQAAAEAAAKAAQEQAAAEAAAKAAQQQAGAGVDASRPMVALTFDDGPQPSVGNRIMDCLAQYGGKATFFMVGDRVAARKTEVQRMVNEGHEVANHTMNHKYLQKLGAAEIQAQVTKCNDAIEAACGVRPTIMRLPGGNHNSTVVANTHMPMIQWNIDTLDWKTKNADKTVSAVLDHVKDGDIILMHELYSQSGDAALRIIPELHKRGFQMVTVSQMAAAKGKTLEAGKLYSEFR